MYALPSHHCRILAHKFFFRAPSVFSLKKAMQSYHDDGMQLISEAERQARCHSMRTTTLAGSLVPRTVRMASFAQVVSRKPQI